MEEYYVNLSKSTLSIRMSLISIQIPGTECGQPQEFRVFPGTIVHLIKKGSGSALFV